jgi:hypothetical protein
MMQIYIQNVFNNCIIYYKETKNEKIIIKIFQTNNLDSYEIKNLIHQFICEKFDFGVEYILIDPRLKFLRYEKEKIYKVIK